ncbi:MAG: hypothetical protein QN198_12495 [Armatimonadota bacterium]|nr:hypothetical protein [Armatimonadota bacterium]MDR5704399.1 hypothetical protein [Armatimonadota bacterium]
MRCPECGSEYVISNVTIRWHAVRGTFLSQRGQYCAACGKTFKAQENDAIRSIRVSKVTEALKSLQESGDIIIVRHRNGTREVIF